MIFNAPEVILCKQQTGKGGLFDILIPKRIFKAPLRHRDLHNYITVTDQRDTVSGIHKRFCLYS